VNGCSPEIEVHTEVAVWVFVGRRPGPNVGKADASWEETSECTMRAAGVGAQASRERTAEITSGRAVSQQGLAATCKDPPTKGQPEAAGGFRSDAWGRMSDEGGVTPSEVARDATLGEVTP